MNSMEDGASGSERQEGLFRVFFLAYGFPISALLYIVLNLPFLDSYPPIDKLGDESWGMNYSIGLLKTGKIRTSITPFVRGVEGDSVSSLRDTTWLHYGGLALFFSVFGAGIWQGRLLSLFYGLITLFITYRIGKDMVDRRTGVLAAVLLASSIFFSLSTREVRAESLFTFILTAGLYLFYRFLLSEKGIFIFLSAIVTGLLIEVHPNGLVACMSLTILYAILCRRRVGRNSALLAAGLLCVAVLWIVVNWLPHRSAVMMASQTILRDTMPPLFTGDWRSYLEMIKDPFFDIGIIASGPAIFMNNIDFAYYVALGIAMTSCCLLMFGMRRRWMLIFGLTMSCLWFSKMLLSLKVCQPAYLAYFMPLFSLMCSSAFYEIHDSLKLKKILRYVPACCALVIVLLNIFDSAETNLRFMEQKKKYDRLMQVLKTTIPADAAVLGSTNYYQAFLGSETYSSYAFMKNSCPDFAMSVNNLNVDYIILDDILQNLSSQWCGNRYFELIRTFLEDRCTLVFSTYVGYPNFNARGNELREVYVFKVKKD